jgi:hypothetical protein
VVAAGTDVRRLRSSPTPVRRGNCAREPRTRQRPRSPRRVCCFCVCGFPALCRLRLKSVLGSRLVPPTRRGSRTIQTSAPPPRAGRGCRRAGGDLRQAWHLANDWTRRMTRFTPGSPHSHLIEGFCAERHQGVAARQGSDSDAQNRLGIRCRGGSVFLRPPEAARTGSWCQVSRRPSRTDSSVRMRRLDGRLSLAGVLFLVKVGI